MSYWRRTGEESSAAPQTAPAACLRSARASSAPPSCQRLLSDKLLKQRMMKVTSCFYLHLLSPPSIFQKEIYYVLLLRVDLKIVMPSCIQPQI